MYPLPFNTVYELTMPYILVIGLFPRLIFFYSHSKDSTHHSPKFSSAASVIRKQSESSRALISGSVTVMSTTAIKGRSVFETKTGFQLQLQFLTLVNKIKI